MSKKTSFRGLGLSICFAIMSVFAPDALPHWIAEWGFWLSLVGVVAFGISYVWDFLKETAWRPSLLSSGIVAFSIFGLILGFGMMYFQHQEFQRTNPKLDGEPQNYGTLKPSSETIVNGVTGALSRTLEFGDSGSGLRQIGPGQPLFKFFGTSELFIELIDEELAVSTRIFDENGNLIAELIRNEWKVAPNPAIWDRNYTKNALEVIGPKGRVVLQVRLVGDRVQLQGEWRGPSGEGIVLAKSLDPNNPGGLIEIVPSGELPTNQIEQILRYPSETHFGEYIK